MIRSIELKLGWVISAVATVSLLVSLLAFSSASAITQLPDPDPIPGSHGIQAIKSKEPPTSGATITTPGNGSSFTESPVTVNGICPDELLVQVYNNGVMVGAVMCENGSFSIEVSLFVGTNELNAVVYDQLYQPGPVSNQVTVSYSNTNFSAFGELITLTSTYGRRSAAAGTQLGWPLQLSGGTGPYAFSIDWGDGSSLDLKSQSLSGLVNLAHTFKKAGIYKVNVKVTDTNGVSAFIQLIAVSNGQVEAEKLGTGEGELIERIIILWIPAAVALILLFPAYWLGRRSQLVSLRNKMAKERDSYEEDQKS